MVDIRKAVDELVLACEVIRRAEECKDCPFSEICLEEYSIVDTAEKMTADLISKFTEMAEDITEKQEESEKSEWERKWDADADYWNLRRSDPDYV